MKLESEEYPFCQLNETINLSPSGQILSRSLMINLRNESPKEVWKAYRELKKLIDGKEDKPEKKTKNSKKETPKTKKENEDKKEQKRVTPEICPKCGGLLVEKSGISKKTGRPYHFLGCSNFLNGCSYTRNIPAKLDKKALPIADEDLIEAI